MVQLQKNTEDLSDLPTSRNHINWTACGTEKTVKMNLIVTHCDETFESVLEIAISESIRFTLVIHEVGTLNFTTSEVQAIWSSIPDNRKVYLKIKDEDLGLIFVDVFKKHQFLELLAFKPADATENLKLRILTWNHARSSQRNVFVCDPE